MKQRREYSERMLERSRQKDGAASMPPSSTPYPDHSVASLQQRLGNRGVLNLRRAGALQAKLEISQPGDIYEQEADRVADEVMRMTEPSVQTKCAPCASGGPPCPKCASEEPMLLRRRTGNEAELSTIPPIVHDVLRSPGQPLDPATRAFMEPRFGYDFRHVRVHTDAKAEESARAINALAYTVRSHMYFGAGLYRPQSTEGRQLIAHELAHVVQQSKSIVGNRGNETDPEADANRAASAIATKGMPPVLTD